MHKSYITGFNQHISRIIAGGLVLFTLLAVLLLSSGQVMARGSSDANSQDWGGCTSCGQMGGIVFNDLNRDGLFGEGELGLPNIRLRLWQSGLGGFRVYRTATTNEQGYYLFIGLPPGLYSVEVDARNALLTTTYNPLPSIYLTGQRITWANFGFYLNDAQITQPPPVSIPSSTTTYLDPEGRELGNSGGQQVTNIEGIPIPPAKAQEFEDLRGGLATGNSQNTGSSLFD